MKPPKLGNEANGLTKVVIAKCKEHSDEVSAYFDTISEVWRLYPSGDVITVKKWMPIVWKPTNRPKQTKQT